MSFQIYPILTGTARVKQFQLTGTSGNLSRLYQLIFTQKWSEWIPIYSWLIRLDDRLLLVDTGETASIFEKGYMPKGGLYHKAVQTRITRNEEIDRQIDSLGFKTDDIHTIILTHLHGDHIGGISHFPDASFWVSKEEYALAISKKGSSNGYFSKNWPSWFKPQLIEYTNEPEGNFSQSYRLSDFNDLIVVPTPGHSIGHQSVIVINGTEKYFIAGDLTYNIATLRAEIPNVIMLNKSAKESVMKVHEYVKSNSCIFLSSHDWNAPKILSDVSKYDQ